jgi:hypothetical protein
MLKFAPGIWFVYLIVFCTVKISNRKGREGFRKGSKRLRRHRGLFTVVRILSRGINADYFDMGEAEVFNSALNR